mgnify:CR=1 FL=1
MNKRGIEALVGLFVLMGLAALVFLALQSANLLQLNFRSGYVITARFDNIGGLKPKAAVRSAGVVVGRVQSITFDTKTYQAEITVVNRIIDSASGTFGVRLEMPNPNHALPAGLPCTVTFPTAR